MRLSQLTVLVLALATLGSASAVAGPFGGFTKDGRYIVGGERICTPIAAPTAPTVSTAPREAASCEKIKAAALAKLTLERPAKEQGARARFTAKGRGTKLSITAAGAASPAVTWDAGAVVGAVRAVFVNKAASAVALEYESRFGGRMVTEVIAFKVAEAAPSKTPAVAPRPPTAPVGPKLSETDTAKYDKALVAAWKNLKRKRWAKAALSANAALALWDQSAEALVVLASSRAQLKDTEATLATLERLATSQDPAAPEYRVEARTATAFASLRADPRFRRAVGITPDPDRPLSAYERLMGFGGKWEQRLIACEQPEVKLILKRTRKRFTLKIKSKCGSAETTYLDGSWAAVGTDALKLTFPNQDAGDEGLTCQVERCRDSSGEDCVRCKVDAELEFLLRVIRR